MSSAGIERWKGTLCSHKRPLPSFYSHSAKHYSEMERSGIERTAGQRAATSSRTNSAFSTTNPAPLML